MTSYRLQIVTPDGLRFDGQAEKLIVRSTTGDVCTLPRHINYVTVLGMGEARVWIDGRERHAACIGGMLSVHDGEVRLVASTFEWQEDIDADRAGEAKERAQEKLAKGGLSDKEYKIAEAKLQRALVRLSVKS